MVSNLKIFLRCKNAKLFRLKFFSEAKQVFEVFDKKYEGKVDAHHIGDMLRALNLAPTNGECEKRGQTPKPGKI